ncbi:MAG: molybdopterin converting factor subunit 1 [Pseudomonadota bacterium]
MMQVLYFGWLRERVGAAAEEIDPGSATTAGELIETLRGRDERYAAAFADTSAIRIAIDQKMAALDSPIEGAREVAFFPPVTGG